MKFRNYDKYEIYEDGRIFSYWTNKFLKPITLHNGYQRVYLYDNEGKRKIYLVHRIVYETFSGEPIPSNMQINHRSEDKTDNRFFENLELVTPKQNINYGSRNERVSKALSKQVGAFNKNCELVMTFSSTQEAERKGFCHSAVSRCCNGKLPNYKGYTWRYL